MCTLMLGYPARLVYHGHTLQLYGYGCRQRIYTYGSAARLVGLEIFGVYFVVGLEVALHIYQEDGDVYQFVPTAATLFQYHPHVLKNAVYLCCEVELYEVTMLVGPEAGYLVGTCLARPYARKKEEVAYAPGVWIQAYRLRGLIGRELRIGHKNILEGESVLTYGFF